MKSVIDYSDSTATADQGLWFLHDVFADWVATNKFRPEQSQKLVLGFRRYFNINFIKNENYILFRRAFRNIYNLLNEDGELFTIFLAGAPVFDVYRVLARNNKWSKWLQDVDRFVSPYHDIKVNIDT